MSKKFNNNILLYTLVILVLIFAVVKLYRWKFTESTLNTKLVEIDTSKVTKLLLYPTSENRSEIKFYKEEKTWKVTKGKIIADLEPNTMQNLINMLLEIKVLRLATHEKTKWAEYNLTDTTATRIKVYQSNKKVLDLYIGKFT